jgi:hypothetical protein
MTTSRSRPRWLRPHPSLCLRTSGHVWFALDRELCASRRWQTQNTHEFAWLLRGCGLLTTSADLLVSARARCHGTHRTTGSPAALQTIPIARVW